MARLRYLWEMVFDKTGRPPPPTTMPNPSTWEDNGVTGSCLGHSTVFLNFLGVRVLTDPVFSLRVGPGFGSLVIGPKRRLRPAVPAHAIPAPDVIVLSHAHFDHLDAPSLRRFSRDTPIVTASGTRDLLRRFRQVHELAWGDSVVLAPRGESIRFTALEVAHWGARMMRDDFRGYNGYLLEREGRSVCFGGDTAYTRAFARLSQRKRPVDLALMPVGAYNPWIHAHCSPEQAIAMAEQAGARFFVPIHQQTFKLSDEPMDEPAQRVRAAFRHMPERLLASDVGETFRFQ